VLHIPVERRKFLPEDRKKRSPQDTGQIKYYAAIRPAILVREAVTVIRILSALSDPAQKKKGLSQ